MPPQINIRRARGQAAVSPAVDFAMCIIGCATLDPLPLKVSPPYGNPSALAAAYGLGDGIDAAQQAVTRTLTGNPAPPAIAFYRTPPTTPGARGATLDVSGVNGSSVVTQTAGTEPVGTYQPVGEVLDDGNGGDGTAVGTPGIVIRFSPDNGRHWLPSQALGTDVTAKMLINEIETGVQFDFTASGDTLKTGDKWYESKTTAPQFAIADIYDAGPPAAGALAVIAKGSYNFGLIAITEPVEAADFATLSAGLNAMTAINAARRPTLIIRFRDSEDDETDAEYVLAFRTWRAAAGDDERIVCVVGSGWLTDAFRSFVYLRSGLPAVLARLQSMQAIAGNLQQRVAQSPGEGARGPLEGFSIVDSDGNPVGHNERVLGGIDAVGETGGGLTFYYEAHDAVAGTYVSRASTCYPVGSKIFTLMDNRVSSGIERALYGVAFTFLQGADIFDEGTHELEEDVVQAMSSAAKKAIKDLYTHEIQNAEDPNLVTVDPTVTVTQERVTVQWYVNDRLFGYTDVVNIEIENNR